MNEHLDISSTSRSDDGSRNRALDTRRDDDTFVVPSITIHDIDHAILWHLQNKFSFRVEENGATIPVPVQIANAETWVQVQTHGYLRHKSRKVSSPLILLSRSSISEDSRVPKLDVPKSVNANSLLLFPAKQRNSRNDWINKSGNTKESTTYFVSVIPDHVKVTYELKIWTDLTSQMNNIVQEIIHQDKLLWGDQMEFSTKILSCDFSTINAAGEDRLVTCDISLEVDGILQAEHELKDSTIRKAFTTKRVVFKNEQSQDEIYVDHKPKIISFSRNRLPKRGL